MSVRELMRSFADVFAVRSALVVAVIALAIQRRWPVDRERVHALHAALGWSQPSTRA
jgi:DNA-binding GntR family transcriptional regulator